MDGLEYFFAELNKLHDDWLINNNESIKKDIFLNYLPSIIVEWEAEISSYSEINLPNIENRILNYTPCESGNFPLDITENKNKFLYSYLYWKYGAEFKPTIGKLSFSKLNDFFVVPVAKSRKILQPIRVQYPCPHCKNSGQLTVNDKLEHSYMEFYCKECGHACSSLGVINSRPSLTACSCQVCMEKRTAIYQSLLPKIETIMECEKRRLDVNLRSLYEELNKTARAQQEELRHQYSLYNSMLTRDESLFIQLAPFDSEDNINQMIDKVINRYKQRNFYKQKAVRELTDNLIKHGVIYKKYEFDKFHDTNSDILEQRLFSLLESRVEFEIFDQNGRCRVSGGGNIRGKEYYIPFIKDILDTFGRTVEEFYQMIYSDQDDGIYFCKKYFLKNDDSVRFKVSIASILQTLEMGIDRWSLFRESYRLNPYYFNTNFKNSENIYHHNLNNIKLNLFLSEAEKTAFTVLRAKMPNFVIVPDRPLYRVINLDKLASLFAAEELIYLKKCILDFCVYDLDGNIMQAIELQKGKHHDEIEWREKDALKKKACELSGILFQEIF